MSTKRSVMILSIGIVMTMIAFFGFIACGGGGGGGGAVPTGTVTGTVLDSDNLPVEAATITISSEPVYTTSDASGFFSIVAESGEHTLTITRGSNTLYMDTISIVGDTTTALGELLPEDPYYSQGGRWYLDSDGDGYGVGRVIMSEGRMTGYAISSELTALFGDCDDLNEKVHPAAAETCNRIDDDCDLSLDEIGCSEILLVDDDNGHNNRARDFPDVDQIYIEDMSALGSSFNFDIYRITGHYSDGPTLQMLQQYSTIVWFTGESFTEPPDPDIALNTADQNNLSAYLTSYGGRLFLSGQDIIYDISVNSFVTSYLGVSVLDEEDVQPIASTVLGVTGDSISNGLALSSCDADGDNKVDNFNHFSVLGSEVGSFIWDTTDGMPGSLSFTATATDFSAPAFSGTDLIAYLSDDLLVFGDHSLWFFTDGNLGPYYLWYETSGMQPNQFREVFLQAINTYTFKEFGGTDYSSWPDIISDNLPSYAQTLLTTNEIPPRIVAVRSAQGGWKTVFIPSAYEGLGPEETRRIFLKRSLEWLMKE